MISVNGVKKQLGYISYAASTAGNPAVNSTYYVGSTERTMTNLTGGQNPVYIPKSGSIKAVYVTWLATGVAGSNEEINAWVILNNGPSGPLVAKVSDANALKTFSNTAFNTAVVQGDYFEIKILCANWATPPTGVAVTAEVYIEVPDAGISINGVKNKSGYVLSPSSAQGNPSDNTTIYIGNILNSVYTTAGDNPVYIPKTGSIKYVYVTWLAVSTVGSNEQIDVYLRLNNTTDTLIASVSDTNRTKIFSNTSLNIPVIQGDYFEIKVVCPTWATNPLAVNISGDIYIEPTDSPFISINGVSNESAYVLIGAGTNGSPADGATYYIGSISQAWTNTTAGNGPIYVPKAGTVKSAYITWMANTAGSNEQIDVYLRLNNTTDTLIASISNTSVTKTFSNTALNIAVVQGDYFEIKVVCPTWATNPANVSVSGEIMIKEGVI